MFSVCQLSYNEVIKNWYQAVILVGAGIPIPAPTRKSGRIHQAKEKN
jgi:hypothetical protein